MRSIPFPDFRHRQETVATIRGVRFINDSKATNAEAAVQALTCYDSIRWIVGGRAKAGGLEAAMGAAGRIARAYLIGEAEARFASELDGRIPYTRCGTLEAAVEAAARDAWSGGRPNEVVLLSPAAASFDQFASYEARGDAFRTLVEGLVIHQDRSEEVT